MVPLEKVALALSDPIRLQVLDLLAAGRFEGCCSPDHPDLQDGLCSCDLLITLDVAPSRLSYHMGQLREAELVTEFRVGRWIYYTLNREALADYRQALQERYLDQ